MFRFQKKYFFLACFLFLIEFIIAVYFHDKIIRPYVGDLLVVILLYCLVRAFVNVRVMPTALGVLFVAYGVEVLQYFRFIYVLNLQHSLAAKLILGNSFEWIDMVAYTLGIGIVLLIEVYSGSLKLKDQR